MIGLATFSSSFFWNSYSSFSAVWLLSNQLMTSSHLAINVALSDALIALATFSSSTDCFNWKAWDSSSFWRNNYSLITNKLGRVFPMVVVSTPIHAEFGSYNHREDVSLFIREKKYPIENFPRDVETLKTENITLKSQPSQMKFIMQFSNSRTC